MKKFISVVLLTSVILAFTGCMKVTYHVTLKDSGKADIEYEMTMDKETISLLAGENSEDPFLEKKQAAKANGFEITSIDTEKESGYKAKIKNIDFSSDTISQSLGLADSSGGEFEVKKGLFKDVNTLNLNIDTTGIFGADSQSQSMIPYVNDSISLRLLITAPGKITSESGTNAEGMANTYEYKINLGQENKISLSYTTPNQVSVIVYCVLGIIIVLSAIAFVIIKFRKKAVLQDEEEIE